MINIPLQAIPNQTLSIQLNTNYLSSNPDNEINNVNFNLRLHSCNNNPTSLGTAIMSVTIQINSSVTPIILIDNVRAVSGSALIGYEYLETYGDFAFITDNDDLPDYNQFGITQYLIYASAAELTYLRALNVRP